MVEHMFMVPTSDPAVYDSLRSGVITPDMLADNLKWDSETECLTVGNVNGNLHCFTGPALQRNRAGFVWKTWYREGQRHRNPADGYAETVSGDNGYLDEYYFVDGWKYPDDQKAEAVAKYEAWIAEYTQKWGVSPLDVDALELEDT